MTSVLFARLAPPAALAALLAMGLLTGRIVLLTGQRDAARAQLGEARALHETDLARLRAAQALARAGQLAEIAALKDDLRRRKDETDRRSDRLHADYRDHVLRIAPAGAGADPAGAAAMPGAGAAGGADRSGADTLLLARDDALICAQNTARLQAAHDWALGLAAER